MKVKFMPQNIELEIAPNQSVKDLADKNNIFIKSICNGLPSCAECRVRVVDGEHNVLPPAAKELSLIGTGYFIDQRRLSCQLLCFGDVTIDLSEQIEKQKQGPKRTQGSKKVEIAVSHAVTGNLIEQDDLKSLAQAPPPAARQPEARDQRQNQGRNDNRGGQNRNGQGGGQQQRNNQGQNRHHNQGNRPQGQGNKSSNRR